MTWRLQAGRTVTSSAVIVALAVLAALSAALLPLQGHASQAQAQSAPRMPTVGRLAPAFSLETFAGERHSLADLRGQVVVINIWATWCAPCRAEMPMMHRYYLGNRQRGLAMFGVTTEDSVNPRHPAMRRLAELLSYPLSNRMRGQYGSVESVPTTFLIDRRGMVRQIHTGAYTAESFRAAVDPLLAESAPAS